MITRFTASTSSVLFPVARSHDGGNQGESPQAMRIKTTNYEDFKSFVFQVVGKAVAVFYGKQPHPHADEIIAIATNGNAMVVYESHSGPDFPESFHSDFPAATSLVEPGAVDWAL
jgi:hypothetical protein